MTSIPDETAKSQVSPNIDHLARHLAFAQFFLLLSWTVYAIYLPALLEQVGLERRFAPWILLGDQVLFVMFDIAAGFAADRAFKAHARIGFWVLMATAVSSMAFLLLPWLVLISDGQIPWRTGIFLGLTIIWVASSAALRSPIFGLLSRHAAKNEASTYAGLALVGMALAAAVSPYLGTLLKGVDPRFPFALASLALIVTAAGLVIAERRYTPGPKAPDTNNSKAVPARLLFPLLLIAAFAFQVAVHLNAAPRYLRDFGATALPWLLPVFWIGFNLTAFTAGRLCAKWGAGQTFAIGCLAGSGGVLLAQLPGGETALLGYALAGLGWGAAMSSAFGLAADAGRPDRVATMTGVVFAVLAAASFGRIGINLAGLPQQAAWSGLLVFAPAVLWAFSGTVMLAVQKNGR